MRIRLSRALARLRALRAGTARPEAVTFLIGCGRSGTTILGTTLGQHPGVLFLGEPRGLWQRAYPETDIWSPEAARRGGRLVLTRADVDARKSRHLARLLAREAALAGKPHLLEKTPINCFRLDFLQALFPEAKFVHIIRHGVEVARSIAGRAAAGRWHGHDNYKLALLRAHAAANTDLTSEEIAALDNFEYGLLEWALSLEAALAFAKDLPASRYSEVRYEDLLARPAEAVLRLQNFMGAPPDPGVSQFALANLARRSARAEAEAPPPSAMRLAGEMLARLGYL